ncbi:aerolysin family beta-barrel pore-forming toxin [Streptomyces sp. NPDC015220]|uniref:aerolysin family beta-barrel pore-forming toxin n=1 Tax=Streptomyces sp. NPDC015220 TaxID=3364947 RepID=UPI0036F959F0
MEWINNEDHPVVYGATMSVAKTDTCSSSWSWTDKFSVGQKITYKVSIKAGVPGGEAGAEIGGETSFGFEHAWGETKTKSHTVTVGVSDSVKSSVPKHSAETAYLFSTLGSAQFRIAYEATLTGWLAFQHRDWYTGADGSSRYRAHKVDTVLRNAGLPTSITVHQDITVGFYSDAIVEVSPGRYNPNKKPGQLSQ